MGQTRPVHAFCLYVRDPCEECLYNLARGKQRDSEAFLGAREAMVGYKRKSEDTEDGGDNGRGTQQGMAKQTGVAKDEKRARDLALLLAQPPSERQIQAHLVPLGQKKKNKTPKLVPESEEDQGYEADDDKDLRTRVMLS